MTAGRRALIVAVDEYHDAGLSRLAAPAQDATALADALGAPGIGDFGVTVLRNGTAQEVRVAVEDFFADSLPDDVLVLHFSCHGLKSAAGELFLAASDSRPDRLASTAVAADFVNRQMADSRAQRIALFLDCCYGGAFPRGMTVRGAQDVPVREAFAEAQQAAGGRGRVVVTASSAVEYAFDGPELAPGQLPTPSVFTGAVVRGLTTGEADRDGDGWVGLHELFAYVTEQVRSSTSHQTPHLWAFGSDGELLLAHSGRRRIVAAPPARELIEAGASPLPATRLGVALELAEVLQGADLPQALGAWEQLDRMRDDDSQRVRDAVATAMAAATPTVDPAHLELERAVDADAHGVLRLTGPPLAREATVSGDVPWLSADVEGASIHVIATPVDDEGTGTLLVSSPTGGASIGVTVRTVRPGRRPPAPARSPATAAPVPEPPARQVPRVPAWVAAGMLLVAAAQVVACVMFVSWSGDLERYAAASAAATCVLSVGVAAAAVLCLLRPGTTPSALGVATGCLLAYLTSGVFSLASAFLFTDDQPSWLVVVAGSVVGLALVAVALARAGVRAVEPAWRWPGAAPVVALVLGAVGVVGPVFWVPSEGYSLFKLTGWGVLIPAVAVAVAAVAVLLRTGQDMDRFVAATAYGFLVASAYATVVWALRNGSGSGMVMVAAVGAAVLCTAVALSRAAGARR
ncbi:caspase family protein [Cellulomonas sp. ICMP 17802]|uniref:caspase family protein n=1 Tax=Cellulomonas sp. ICMP 17802 TaxID=3239199 RepID=UPI00351B4895